MLRAHRAKVHLNDLTNKPFLIHFKQEPQPVLQQNPVHQRPVRPVGNRLLSGDPSTPRQLPYLSRGAHLLPSRPCPTQTCHPLRQQAPQQRRLPPPGLPGLQATHQPGQQGQSQPTPQA